MQVNWSKESLAYTAVALLSVIFYFTMHRLNTPLHMIPEAPPSSSGTYSPTPPTYSDFPVGNTPLWFRQDIKAIAKAMNIWVAPARYSPASKDGIGGCRANSDLALVVGSFLSDLNRRQVPSSLRAVQKELHDAAIEMETGAHLRDAFCKALDQDLPVDEATALDVHRGFTLVHKGYIRLRHACSPLDRHGETHSSDP